jgi:predicted flap endonuclease-1-like 5' DNA nuclease/chromosome segregation ATPase
MYLLSQLWLYLLLACLAGLALGLLLNRICQQRRHAAQLAALESQHREERSRHELALTGLRGEHARTLDTLTAERGVLQARLDTLGAEHHEAGERVRVLSASVDQHQVVRQGLGEEVEALQLRLDGLTQEHQSLQAVYESRLALLNTETSRAVNLTDELADLRVRHAALETAHQDTLTRQAEVAKEAYAALMTAQAERDAALTSAAAVESERLRERQAALLAVGATAGATLMTRQRHQDEVAALQGDLSHHQTLLSAETGRGADLRAELAAARQATADAEAVRATQAARAAEIDAELNRERQAALLAAGAAAAAALASRQLHQDELAAHEQQCAEQAAQRDRRIAELQGALDDQETARRTAEAQAQALRDAQAALQSTAQLREQALQQELAQSQARGQDLEAELRALRLTLAEAVSRAAPPPPLVIERPAPSSAALMGATELERLVMAAGAGQQPAPVEIDQQHPDDLKIIDGIGPVNERWLHAQGVHYFWQIACWTPGELAWVANHLPNFGSRVYRENWVAQAAKLAAQQRQQSMVG